MERVNKMKIYEMVYGSYTDRELEAIILILRGNIDAQVKLAESMNNYRGYCYHIDPWNGVMIK